MTGIPAVGVVAGGGTRKLALLRANPRATVVLRVGGQWAAVDGPAQLAGPDDPMDGIDAERRTAILVTPARMYRNP